MLSSSEAKVISFEQVSSADYQRAVVRSGYSRRANNELGIPKRNRGKSLENYDATPEFKQSLIDSLAVGSLYLWGNVGTGKTHGAIGVLLDAYAKALDRTGERWIRPAARFVNCGELLGEIKQGFSSGGGEQSKLQELTKLKFFVLDDFGAARFTEFTRELLAELVDKLYLYKTRGAVFTFNLGLAEVAARIDDRTASRLAEMCRVIKLDGDDHRIKKTKQSDTKGR